ncbi:MAG: GHKL domain-containing protein [Lachnospiraceae bacterium]|nr:GHKL domain-containing protein [Lachnospiraceae bacterium]
MNNAIHRLFILSALLYILCLFALLTGSRGYLKETPSYAGGVQQVTQVWARIDGTEEAVTLPHSFSLLPARTPVTLSAEISVMDGDCLYVKSVYAPLRVYANDKLIFESGQEGSFPRFMEDPATTVAAVPLGDFSQTIRIRLEYLSPKTRSALPIQPLLVGKLADILACLLKTMGLSFIISLVQITLGLLLIFVALAIVLFERKGIVFLYLGLSSLAMGLWCFGECNLTGLLIPNPTLLYLFAFMGFFSVPVPLLLFAITIIPFHDDRPLRFLCLANLSAAATAFLAQLLGIAGFSRSMRFFHVLVLFSLLFLAGYILYEGLLYRNQPARRFFLPMAVLTLGGALEMVNYGLRFTDVLSSVFQIGGVLFTLMTGIVGGLFIRDALRLKQQKQRLSFEVSLMKAQTEEQKKRHQMLLQSAEAVKKQQHDLRHQLAVIRSYSAEGNNRRLNDYLDTLTAQIPAGSKTVYCENLAVNAVVSHYAAIAEENGIECSICLTVPEQLERITDSSLCVIFGNLFENAIEACARMTVGKKFVRLNSRLQYKTLAVTMDNSFDGRFTERDGRAVSSKHADYGIGTGSIAAIARQHGGDARFEADGLVFLSSVYVRL